MAKQLQLIGFYGYIPLLQMGKGATACQGCNQGCNHKRYHNLLTINTLNRKYIKVATLTGKNTICMGK